MAGWPTALPTLLRAEASLSAALGVWTLAGKFQALEKHLLFSVILKWGQMWWDGWCSVCDHVPGAEGAQGDTNDVSRSPDVCFLSLSSSGVGMMLPDLPSLMETKRRVPQTPWAFQPSGMRCLSYTMGHLCL